MGGHYGSIQVRSEDRERVRAVAEQVARDKGIHILVAPPVNGWIALFPEDHGQDDSVGNAVAEQLDADVLHLLVHDDDIFAYWLYRDRRLIDAYWSAPGYFGEENRAREEAMAGNPEAFRPLIGEEVRRLAELLDRSSPETFEHERLGRFAKLLKITNAVNAFEYLKDGERTGIRNWRQFVEVPAEAVLKKAQRKRQERDRIAAEQKRLKEQGLLLLAETRKEIIPYGCPAGGGFLVAWPDYLKGIVTFDLCREPWEEPVPISLGTPDHLAGIASDASARRVAFTAGKRVAVWDLGADGWAHTCDVPESDLAVGVALAPDGKCLAHCSRKEIVITRIDRGGERLLAWPTRATPQSLAFHPSGEWLAASGNTLGLLALGDAEPWRDLYIGGEAKLPAAYAAVFRAKMHDIDFEEVERRQKEAMDTMIARLRKAGGRSKKLAFSEEQVETMKRQMKEQFAEMKSRLLAMKEGRLPPQPSQAREQVRFVGFSRDGRWLWCGTSAGLRVYEWAAVPRTAGADMPPAKWNFQVANAPADRPESQIYSIVEESDASAIAFGGGDGRLYRLDLNTGEARELIKMGDDTAIVRLALSADGRTLGAVSVNTPSRERAAESRDRRSPWTVWSYPKLRGPFERLSRD